MVCVSLLKEAIQDRMLIIDGAMGTALQEMDLSAEDFGGEAYNGCNEHLVLTRPDVVLKVHQEYLEAGADIIETNTFGGTALVLAEFDLQDHMDAINTRAVELARQACEAYSTPEKPRFVAGAIGPTTKALSVTGGITFDELTQEFYAQACSLIKAGPDYLLVETCLDTLNIKAAYCGILKAFNTLGKALPVAVSVTIENMGTLLAGQSIEAVYTSLEHMDLLYIGINCATGPEFMRDHLRTLSSISRFPVAVVPNAGIPNEDGQYDEDPEMLSETLLDFANQGWLNLVGGCCGTTAAHIQKLHAKIAHLPNRRCIQERVSRLSGIETLVLEDDGRPYIVGERTNVIGSRAFKRLIEEEKWDEAAEIARKQVQAGAHIIDICLSNPDRDEAADTIKFYEKVTKMIKVPIMVDSQVPEVVETAFKLTQGKCILNSVNLEDGEKSFEELLPLVKQYGASVVVGCIEGEMAVTAEDKLRVAMHSYELLTKKYGIPEEDIIFDPLVFPCGTGDENYFGSGKETIEGVRLIKEKYPRCKTTLGISNVSFGLPSAGREVLNSVFVYHCTKAGLDTAIVNSQKLERYSNITDEEKALCDDLLWYRTDEGHDPVAAFAAYFRDKEGKVVEEVDRSNLSIEEKLEVNIVQGTKEYLIDNLDEALQQWDALGVINNPLMRAMGIVGKLFNDNELIVAEVLQSAEVMKAAVAYLETFMEKTEVTVRGTVILATVKGDVHDIGKNLVDIILTNNGYKVIDLGIKCPPETLIEAVKTHKPDMIGLSGLLVKSAQQMVITAADFKSAGISLPILVGGAALTETFTNLKIQAEYDGPCIYCKDAMTGLDWANKLTSKDAAAYLEVHRQQQAETLETLRASKPKERRPLREKIVFDHSDIRAKAPHFNPVILEERFSTIWPYINQQMVYGNHLGLKGNVNALIEKQDPKAMKLKGLIDELRIKIDDEQLLTAKGIYQYFKAKADGDTLVILDSNSEQERLRIPFPRQQEGYQLCLTDFLHPTEIDTVAFFVVTAGDGIAEKAKEMASDGLYFESHGLQAIALEAAEGFAEYIHQRIRSDWGIGDQSDLSAEDLFKLKYTGCRFSFGYPACPRLEDQGAIWELLKPDHAIGVDLSEEFMMYPEASVSALVFHHPQARYFRINELDLAEFVAELS